MLSRTQLGAALLSLIGNPTSVAPSEITQLSSEEWDWILGCGRQHRLLPYMQYTMRKAGLLSYLPNDVQEQFAVAHRRSAIRALTVQSDLLATHVALSRAGIEHVFLKGAYLAQFAYPEPGLRPLRDIDVLVSSGESLEAYAALQSAGFERRYDRKGMPESFIETSKHLPHLIAPSGGTTVELHLRISDNMRYNDPKRVKRVDEVMERAQEYPVAAYGIRFPAPEDLLLHLCIHAVYDHQFDNGPLILPDLYWLLARHSLDWSEIWRRAADQGAERCVALTLKLLEQVMPTSEELVRERIPDLGPSGSIVVGHAVCLLLRSVKERSDVAIRGEMASKSSTIEKVDVLRRRILPTRSQLAKHYALSPGSPALMLCYPHFWMSMAKSRLPFFLRNMRDDRLSAEVASLSVLNRWLSES